MSQRPGLLIAKANGPMPRDLTKAQLRALCNAAGRERGNICPTVGVYAAASDALVAALDRAGFVTWDGEAWKSAPRVNDAGRAALAKANQP
jgi:hypothetical protein